MNENLMEILTREIVNSLPREEREMYQYVIRMEDELAQQAATSEEFMSLLIQNAPHQQAANHFQLTYGQFMVKMRGIEKDIHEQLDMVIDQVQWFDYTNMMRKEAAAPKNMKFFYFDMGRLHTKP
ncbi:hypothetical protein [Rossellomorea vietnamensis]|uniref:hypothetical protein n=1 Tax=Rossellomorea vietnamensis TaxID=218284 RepID=UPI001E421688|nr:hypothetical protein [Rossellomorea vietnamensis]MCC5801669.1 hypothetical protein [Rossellomorea vietnamensis]